MNNDRINDVNVNKNCASNRVDRQQTDNACAAATTTSSGMSNAASSNNNNTSNKYKYVIEEDSGEVLQLPCKTRKYFECCKKLFQTQPPQQQSFDTLAADNDSVTSCKKKKK